jgi:hypothetical protein
MRLPRVDGAYGLCVCERAVSLRFSRCLCEQREWVGVAAWDGNVGWFVYEVMILDFLKDGLTKTRNFVMGSFFGETSNKSEFWGVSMLQISEGGIECFSLVY